MVPEGWAETTLGGIGKYINGRGFKSSEWSQSGRPIIRIQDLTGSKNNPNYYDGEIEAKYVIHQGDLLISWSATLGVFIWNGPEGVLNQHIFKVETNIDLQFHRYIAESVLNDLFRKTHGSGMVHVTKGEFEQTSILLPPFVEQKRIAAQVEKLLAQVKAAQARLDRVPTILKRFRQSVLAAAFLGHLTEEWRETRPTTKSATVVLDEMAAESAIIPGRKKRSLPESDYSGLPALPDDWLWVPLDSLIRSGPNNGVYKPAEFYGGGIAIVRIEDYQDFRVPKLETLSRIRLDAAERNKFELLPNDILINRVNSPSHIGKCLQISELLVPSVFESNMMRFSPSIGIDASWLALYLKSPSGRAHLTKNAKWAVNQVSINQTDVRRTPVPLAPLEEQGEIVTRVQALLQLADAIEQRVVQAQGRIDKTNQAILARAFRGELVPTEAELARQEGRDYEPASALLERIEARGRERAKASSR